MYIYIYVCIHIYMAVGHPVLSMWASKLGGGLPHKIQSLQIYIYIYIYIYTTECVYACIYTYIYIYMYMYVRAGRRAGGRVGGRAGSWAAGRQGGRAAGRQGGPRPVKLKPPPWRVYRDSMYLSIPASAITSERRYARSECELWQRSVP